MNTLSILISVILVGTALGHGRLAQPPGRSSAWKFGFGTPVHFNDWQLNCGGYDHHMSLGGKCGVCGDPYDGPRLNEAPNGKYFTGMIVENYKAGSVIDVRVEMLANHRGWIVFKICPALNDSQEVTQECLDRYPLEIIDSPTPRKSRYEWEIPGTYTDDVAPGWDIPSYSFKLKLPEGLTCKRCVLQWDWTCANRGVWDGQKYATGIGPQETFRGCADVRIVA